MSKKPKDDLGSRMKENYENRSKTSLMRRTPVALRLDGKSFHTFTRGFEKPFDEILLRTMQETMLELCKNISGCVFGYTQSDEITLILTDYKRLTSEAYFDYEVQKVCSVAASMCTMKFNKIFSEKVKNALYNDSYDKVYLKAMLKAVDTGAMFDCRAFNIPFEEVTNLIYWRQHDASKNSISMVARAYFSHKEVNNKNGSQMQDMLMDKYQINWNNYPTDCKRGSCCIKDLNFKWFVDKEIPIFKGADRSYIENIIRYSVNTSSEE